MVQASQQPTRITITSVNNVVPSGSSIPGGSGYTTSGYTNGGGYTTSGYVIGPSGLKSSGYSSGSGYTTSGYVNGPSGLTSSSYNSGPGYTTSGYMNGPSGLTGSSYSSGVGSTASGYMNGASKITGSGYSSGLGYATGGYTVSSTPTASKGIPTSSINKSSQSSSGVFDTALATFRELPNGTRKVVGTIGNAVIASEKAAGQDIAAAIGASAYENKIMQIRANEQASFSQMVKQRDTARAAGQDTSKLDAQIKNFKYTPDDTSTIFPAVKKTNGQVIGDFAGVALDATTGGLSGEAKAVKGIGAAANVVRETSVVGGDAAKAARIETNAVRTIEVVSPVAVATTPAISTALRLNHVFDGGVVITKSGKAVGTGGHFVDEASNISIDRITGAADKNGVSRGLISVKDPNTGVLAAKAKVTTFFPSSWTREQATQETWIAFKNSKPVPKNPDQWEGISPSGVKIRGYFGKETGTAVAAWPIYLGN
jgi:hypothetical protein